MHKAHLRLSSAIALALLTEAPESRLRLPEAEQTPVERHVSTLLRLLALIGEVRLEEDDFTIAQALATIDDVELARFETALAVIDLPRWRRPLNRCAQVLLRGVSGAASSDERVLEIAQRLERYLRFATRQLFWHGEISGDLENALIGYLDEKARMPAWKSASRQTPIAAPILTPLATRCDGDDGGLCVILQIADDEILADPLQGWIEQASGAELFTSQTRRALASATTAFTDPQGRYRWHGMPEGRIIGKLLHGRDPLIPAYERLMKMQLDDVLQELADTYAWAFIRWPNTMQESALAFVTRDASLADEWISLLRRHNRQRELIASYWNITSLQAHAGGAQFGESHSYGEAALIAAATESTPPWLVVNVQQRSAHAWRRRTARLGIGAAAAYYDRSGTDFIGVYRADDVEAYRALWRGLDDDDGVVQATACGRNTAVQVMEACIGAPCRCGFRACNALSQRLGWIYTHVHGGGRGEHHAMFHARDPALTNRVVAYAAKQPGWYLSGRW